jgi:hypothetical protein
MAAANDWRSMKRKLARREGLARSHQAVAPLGPFTG